MNFNKINFIKKLLNKNLNIYTNILNTKIQNVFNVKTFSFNKKLSSTYYNPLFKNYNIDMYIRSKKFFLKRKFLFKSKNKNLSIMYFVSNFKYNNTKEFILNSTNFLNTNKTFIKNKLISINKLYKPNFNNYKVILKKKLAIGNYNIIFNIIRYFKFKGLSIKYNLFSFYFYKIINKFKNYKLKTKKLNKYLNFLNSSLYKKLFKFNNIYKKNKSLLKYKKKIQLNSLYFFYKKKFIYSYLPDEFGDGIDTPFKTNVIESKRSFSNNYLNFYTNLNGLTSNKIRRYLYTFKKKKLKFFYKIKKFKIFKSSIKSHKYKYIKYKKIKQISFFNKLVGIFSIKYQTYKYKNIVSFKYFCKIFKFNKKNIFKNKSSFKKNLFGKRQRFFLYNYNITKFMFNYFKVYINTFTYQFDKLTKLLSKNYSVENDINIKIKREIFEREQKRLEGERMIADSKRI